MDRWKEEVQLLLEEMRRVKVFFGTRAQQWESRADDVRRRSESEDPALIEGQIAFASEQAGQFRCMKASCEHLWRYVEVYVAKGGQGVLVPPEAAPQVDDE